MPLILNPSTQASAPDFRNAVKSHLVTYSATVLTTDPFVASPTPGYLAYQKRQAFANKAIQNPDTYLEQACVLLSNLDSVMLTQTLQSYTNELFRFIGSDNPVGRHLFECDPAIGYSHVGITSGKSIFEVLAGISQLDYA